MVAEFFEWLKTELATSALLPRNPFTVAASYALERKAGLEVFLGDPDVPIDTNHLERTLRPIPMGRKNWLFSTSVEGGKSSANLYSLIETAKANGLDPYQYLRYVFTELPKANSVEQIEALLPWNVNLQDGVC